MPESLKRLGRVPTRAVARYWRELGPGLVTGAADDDPSGIATYSQMGAQYGFQYLWAALFTFPLMAVVQEMTARIGMVTGRGLSDNIRRQHSKTALYLCITLLLIANTFNIGADIGAMAEAARLFVPINAPFLIVFFALLNIVLQIFIPYKSYAKYLKYLTFVLFSYVLTGLIIHIDWLHALQHTLVPSMTFTKDAWFLLCGVLGTTITPYLFFWQPAQEIEEEIAAGRTTVESRLGVTHGELRAMWFDTWYGMFFSNFVMFFIILVCGATLFAAGITNIQTAAQAALALRPLAGEWAYALFALGILGTGLLAIPVLTGSSAYAVSEMFGWREGLFYKPLEAVRFYGVIVVSTAIALLLNFIGLDPIKALIYSAVLNGVAAPVIIYFIVRISSNGQAMGEHKNNPFTALLGWTLCIAMSIVGIAAIWTLFT